MYRLRTADKGKPLIISDDVIREYSDCHVDTLHKKNLLSLGEDRYLTTLMTKYFPYMSYKFIPDAYCQTAAPETWSVLLSQRRRWINSTIHNLAELMWLKEMCGFCFFSMRFVVFVDLFGTIILPATCFYLGFLVYVAATHQGQFPLISIILLAAVYGLQALIFILKRQWQHVGWMIIYIIAYPVHSFILPVYSFWNQDNFAWGNTRIVVGETGKKQYLAVDDEGFDPRTIPLQRWDDYALVNNLPGRRGTNSEKVDSGPYEETYELDDMKSVYSSVRQASILTGLPGRGAGAFMPPQSPAAFPQGGSLTRNSTYVNNSPFNDPHGLAHRQSMASMGVATPGAFANDMQRTQSPYHDAPTGGRSMTNLRMSMNQSPGPALGAATPRASTVFGYAGGNRPPLGMHADSAGHMSTVSFDFQRGNAGPDDGAITDAIQSVLREVDLDTVTKKQVRALVEQRLQTELVGERRTFMDRQIDNELANM
jgi:chitin synthase